MAASGAAHAVIHGDLLRLGYPGTTGPAVRLGAWTPVVVQLRLEGAARFTGYLRLRQFDRDGDVAEDSVPVTLLADSGGATEYTLYTVFSGQVDESRLHVELVNTDTADGTPRLVEMFSGGKAVKWLPVEGAAEVINDDDMMIMSVSNGQLGKLRVLRGEPGSAQKYDRSFHLVHGPPSMLPNLALGLESVDAIVWDDADPTMLTEVQADALLAWVRRGGRLVLAAARTASTLAQSDTFGPLLPVEVGPVAARDNLPTIRDVWVHAGEATSYKDPVTVASCKLRSGQDVRELLHEEGVGTIVAERRVGTGSILYVAASIHELLNDPAAQADQFFAPLLQIRSNPLNAAEISTDTHALFGHLESEIAFLGAGSAYLALALLFAAAYTLGSTLGAWRFLGKRNLLRHSWTVMAGAGVAASIITILVVQAVHGYARRVHQVTIVDGTAGSAEAVATAWFGLTTPTVSRLDLWLPDDVQLRHEPAATACMLRPLPEWRAAVGDDAGFTDPAQYGLRPATSELNDVMVRATLKELEGAWSGQLSGTIRADLSTADLLLKRGKDETQEQPRAYLLKPESWVENGLGVDLEDCWLFVAEHDLYAAQKLSRLGAGQRSLGDEIRAYPLGKLKRDQRMALSVVVGERPEEKLDSDMVAAWSLSKLQKAWAGGFISAMPIRLGGDGDSFKSSLEDYKNSVLLLTVLSEIDPSQLGSNVLGARSMLSRTHCRMLDRSDRLSRRTALFVGFGGDPGPARLCARSGSREFTKLDVPQARTAYRFVIPVAAPER